MEDTIFKVGEYTEKFNALTGQDLPLLDIVQSTGLEKHVLKRHPLDIQYLEKISEIIVSPDYIGQNPKEPNSIELIKSYSDDVQIAIKLDSKNNYYFVASLYQITKKKINNRLFSGRLKEFV